MAHLVRPREMEQTEQAMTTEDEIRARLGAVAAHPDAHEEVVAALVCLLTQESPAESHRIAPRLYARRRGLPEEAVIDTFLLATKAGLLEFELLPRCDACGGFCEAGADWNQLSKATGRCDACDCATEVSLDASVEVVFSLDRSLRRLTFDPFADVQSYVAHVFSRSFEHGPRAAACLEQAQRATFLLPPGGTLTKTVDVKTGQELRLVSVDAHMSMPVTVREGGASDVQVSLRDGDVTLPRLAVAPGAVRLTLRNLRSAGVGLFLMDDVRAQMRLLTRSAPAAI
ncbi:MAG: DUF5939 domain-containing protein, partial [Myxococcota bacterium]